MIQNNKYDKSAFKLKDFFKPKNNLQRYAIFVLILGVLGGALGGLCSASAAFYIYEVSRNDKNSHTKKIILSLLATLAGILAYFILGIILLLIFK